MMKIRPRSKQLLGECAQIQIQPHMTLKEPSCGNNYQKAGATGSQFNSYYCNIRSWDNSGLCIWIPVSGRGLQSHSIPFVIKLTDIGQIKPTFSAAKSWLIYLGLDPKKWDASIQLNCFPRFFPVKWIYGRSI